MTSDEADKLQRAYLRKRRKWLRDINWPWADDPERPDPGELDAEDPENG